MNDTLTIDNNQIYCVNGGIGHTSLSFTGAIAQPKMALNSSKGEFASINTDGIVKIDWIKCREAACGPKDAVETMWATLLWHAGNPGVAP